MERDGLAFGSAHLLGSRSNSPKSSFTNLLTRSTSWDVCRHPLRKPASDPGSNGHLGYEEFRIFIAFLQFNKKVHQSGMWATKRHAKCFLAGRINPSRKKACVSVIIRMRLAKVGPCSVALTKFELFFCLFKREKMDLLL